MDVSVDGRLFIDVSVDGLLLADVSVDVLLFMVVESVAEAVVSVVLLDLSVALYGDLQAAIPRMAAATIKNRNFI
jgi:hypothetical protein